MPREHETNPTVGKVIAELDRLYPQRWAESWDRVGLVCGHPDDLVSRVHFAVDPVEEVITEALDRGANLLVTHHPLLLKPVSSVAATTFKGNVLHRLIQGRCALYVAHTNADTALPGVSDALGRVLGLDNLRPLRAAPPDQAEEKLVTFVPTDHVDAVLAAVFAEGAGVQGNYRDVSYQSTGTGHFTPQLGANPTLGEVGQPEVVQETRLEVLIPTGGRQRVLAALRGSHPYEEPAFDVVAREGEPTGRGLGRVGELPEAVPLEQFADVVARSLPHTAQGIRVAGPPKAMVRTVAVCGGAGDSMFDQVRASGADVYVTADLRHHPASEAREAAQGGAPYLVDVAHWASEWPWLNGCANRLAVALDAAGTSVEMMVSALCTDPWTFRVPSSGGLLH